jgi:hypothetical protein
MEAREKYIKADSVGKKAEASGQISSKYEGIRIGEKPGLGVSAQGLRRVCLASCDLLFLV